MCGMRGIDMNLESVVRTHCALEELVSEEWYLGNRSGAGVLSAELVVV